MKNFKYILIALLIILISILVVIYIKINKTQEEVNPIPSVLSENTSINSNFNPYDIPSIQNTTANQENIKFKKLLNSKVNQFDGRMSVYVKDLKDGEVFKSGSLNSYVPASTFKIVTAVLILRDVEDGKYNLEETIEYDIETSIEDDNGIQTDVKKDIVRSSIAELLRLSIVYSDNISHKALVNLLGKTGNREEVDKRIFSELSLYDTSLVNFEITSSDLGKLFENLYSYKLLNIEHTDYLIDLMKTSSTKTRIAAGVPEGVVVANKIGSLDNNVHDCAIVYAKNTDYVIVVLNEGLGYIKAENAISEISEIVWEYINDKLYYEEDVEYLN